MDNTGSGSCSITGFHIRGGEHSGFAVSEFAVCHVGLRNINLDMFDLLFAYLATISIARIRPL
jgi:hypothetical protein